MFGLSAEERREKIKKDDEEWERDLGGKTVEEFCLEMAEKLSKPQPRRYFNSIEELKAAYEENGTVVTNKQLKALSFLFEKPSDQKKVAVKKGWIEEDPSTLTKADEKVIKATRKEFTKKFGADYAEEAVADVTAKLIAKNHRIHKRYDDETASIQYGNKILREEDEAKARALSSGKDAPNSAIIDPPVPQPPKKEIDASVNATATDIVEESE
jgi:hypothetical protein